MSLSVNRAAAARMISLFWSRLLIQRSSEASALPLPRKKRDEVPVSGEGI